MGQFLESEYCTFIFKDGRKCRALKMPTRHVCIEHWQHDGQFEQDEAALIELAAVSRTLDSRRGVRKALATLWRLIATDRIPPRKASLLAYTGQLLLSSMGAVRAEAAEPAGKESAEPADKVWAGFGNEELAELREVIDGLLQQHAPALSEANVPPTKVSKPNGSGANNAA